MARIVAVRGVAGNTVARRPSSRQPATAALRDEPVTVIVTVGRDVDPARFGPQPPHIRVERDISQRLLLPRCAVMINVAGLNAVRSAFEHDLPLREVSLSCTKEVA